MAASTSAPPERQALTLSPAVAGGALSHLLDPTPPGGGGDSPEADAQAAKRFFNRVALVVCLIVPVVLVSLYYLFIAADLYVSESRFVLRQSTSVDAVSSAVGAAMQSTGIESADEGSYIVQAFIESRDIVELLVRDNDLLARLDRAEADFVAAYPSFWRRKSSETLNRRFAELVSLTLDKSTGISTLTVKAFRPDDARDLAIAVLGHAEALVNRLNTRARADAIAFAEEVVARNETRVKAIQDQLAEYRNRELVIDPAKQSTATIELSSRLSLELAQINTMISELVARSPSSPQTADLRVRSAALSEEIKKQKTIVVGGDASLASKLAVYEKLSLEKDLAVKALTSSLTSLEMARQDAIMRRLYLERIVEPNLSDRAQYPRRLLIVFGTFAFCLSLYWIVRSLINLTLEHVR